MLYTISTTSQIKQPPVGDGHIWVLRVREKVFFDDLGNESKEQSPGKWRIQVRIPIKKNRKI